jgi:hypothetical protein
MSVQLEWVSKGLVNSFLAQIESAKTRNSFQNKKYEDQIIKNYFLEGRLK